MTMQRPDTWRYTSRREPRGYIQPQALEELWFHTGTRCNLRCAFCLEGSGPQDDRIEPLTLDDARCFIAEALDLGVRRFAFSGGEPFVNPEIVPILAAALTHRPCLVLTNATEPLLTRLDEVLSLREAPHPLRFRVSLDHPDPAAHDRLRGAGSFAKALATLGRLHRAGFGVSLARQILPGEESAAVDRAYAPHLRAAGVAEDLPIVSFPELQRPGALPAVPEITETCMNRYLSAERRAALMCNFSKMVVRKNGRCGVYACTLVDDVAAFDLGPTLREALPRRVMLAHHRCYACFKSGASCSEGSPPE